MLSAWWPWLDWRQVGAERAPAHHSSTGEPTVEETLAQALWNSLGSSEDHGNVLCYGTSARVTRHSSRPPAALSPIPPDPSPSLDPRRLEGRSAIGGDITIHPPTTHITTLLHALTPFMDICYRNLVCRLQFARADSWPSIQPLL